MEVQYESSSSSDDTFRAVVAASAYYFAKRKKKLLKKQAGRKSRLVADLNELRQRPEAFLAHYHMDVKTFDEIFAILNHRLLPMRYARPEALTPLQEFSLALEYLVSGMEPLSKQHVGTIIDTVCDAIAEALMFEVREMTTEELCNVVNATSVGAVDRQHVMDSPVPKTSSLFYNYRGFNSKLLFAVADAKNKFYYFDIGGYGSDSDIRKFAATTLGKNISAGTIEFPENGNVDGAKMPFVFLEDDTFPLLKNGHQKCLLGPTCYNMDNALVVLCARWLVLQHKMHCFAESAVKVVYACCLLHNYLITKSPVASYYLNVANRDAHDTRFLNNEIQTLNSLMPISKYSHSDDELDIEDWEVKSFQLT